MIDDKIYLSFGDLKLVGTEPCHVRQNGVSHSLSHRCPQPSSDL